MEKKLGFIGTGNMAGAIMGGIISQGIFKPEEIIGADLSEAGRKKVKETYGICVTEDNKKVVEEAEIVILSVKPQFYPDVIAEINEPDSPLYAQNHVGINNVKKRLQLIYGDRALYAFFNRDMGERMGSVSEILIPIDLAMLHAAEDEPDGEEAFNG